MRTTWLMVASAALACTAPADPDPAAVRLAALTVAAAADSIDDLQAVDDPDAAGVRDAFHNATREALVAARQAQRLGTCIDGRRVSLAASKRPRPPNA